MTDPNHEQSRPAFEAAIAEYNKPSTTAGIRWFLWCRALTYAAQQAQQWQPIETAPKDGTEVFLWDGGDRVVGYWSIEKRRWHSQTTYEPVIGPFLNWMPLPPSPGCAAQQAQQTCVWTYDWDQEAYDAQCGECWSFTDGGPVTNRYLHCPGCGRKVEVKIETTEPTP